MNRTFKIAVVAGLVATTIGCTRQEIGDVKSDTANA
jgi:hypothetical protein